MLPRRAKITETDQQEKWNPLEYCMYLFPTPNKKKKRSLPIEEDLETQQHSQFTFKIINIQTWGLKGKISNKFE